MTKPLSIYIIAGEASGDFLGAAVMRAWAARHPPVRFHGIGGERMQRAGLVSLFPMEELSVMGFAEVLPHIRRLKRRIRETVADIRRIRPDIVLTIDSPGFNFRVVKALRRHAPDIHAVHLVAPTVWAYKPERARKTAALYDHLLALLPFEPPYFEAEGLPTTFIGHPQAWDWRIKGDAAAFRARYGMQNGDIVLGMMPGSRGSELARHLPIFRATALRLKERYPSLRIVMPTLPRLADSLRRQTSGWPLPVHLIVGDAERKDAFAACDAALAKSGTVSLETVLAGIPTVTAYRANPVSIWLIRRMIRIPYANLVNIIEGRELVPELLQERCTPANLAEAVTALLENDTLRSQQLAAGLEVAAKLGAKDALSPEEKAVAVMGEVVKS